MSNFNKPRFLSFVLLLFLGCTSLDYVSGLYEPSPEQQVDVLVRVRDHKGIALTDLTLNDFYIKHNNRPLERKNALKLNEPLAAVKLYMVVLVDQRENPGLKNSFERTREALKAYLTLQPQNMYIQLIGYDTDARVLHSDFSNDRAELQALVRRLEPVTQSEASNLEAALSLAEQRIHALPNGPQALDPALFSRQQIQNSATSPLYNSAILLMNHNFAEREALRPYVNRYNFVVLDSTGTFRKMSPARLSVDKSAADESGEGEEFMPNKAIFEVYQLPPGDLNRDIDQTKTIKLMNRIWDSLNNIVNGYYWFTYQKYTDIYSPNQVAVSLTQYSRSQDAGPLMSYAESEAVVLLEDRQMITGVVKRAMLPERRFSEVPANLAKPVAVTPVVPAAPSSLRPDSALLAENLETAPELKALPQDVASVPTIENFMSTGSSDFIAMEDNESWEEDLTAPQYIAEPIQEPFSVLPVGTEVSYELLEREEPKEWKEDQRSKERGSEIGERYIQVGAFVRLESLYNLIDRLSSEYNVQAFTSTVNGQEYNRCIIGPFGSTAVAMQTLERLKTQGNLDDAFMIQQPIAQWIAQ